MEYTKSMDLRDIAKSGKVVLKFYADWCGPCRMLSPIMEEVTKENNITLISINVDEHPDVASTYTVSTLPTTLVINDGELVNEKSGFMPKPVLEKLLGV